MSSTLEAVRPITLAEIEAARGRIAGTIVRTPLVRLDLGPGNPDIRLKLENLQPINAYKLRGAANAVAMLSEAERGRGVWTISAGNAGQGVAYAARQAGVPCTVVAIETAPASKLERMRALGAKLVPVPYEVAWKALDDRSYPGVEGTFVHPFDDHNFIAGHGTMGLEILEDAPDTAAVIARHRRRRPRDGRRQRRQGAEARRSKSGAPSPRPPRPAALSFAMGSPQDVPGLEGLVRRRRRRPKRFPAHVGADEAGGGRLHRRQPRRDEAGDAADGGKGARHLRRRRARCRWRRRSPGRPGRGPIVAIVSGGNIDLKKFCDILSAAAG